MILAEVILGARHWLVWASLLAAVALAAVAWSYARSYTAGWVKALASLLKAVGIVALAICLVEPLYTGTRPRPGSNLFLVVADNSRSLELADRGSRQTRGEAMRERLADEASWLARLGQDFDVRRYAFDTTLRPVKSFAELSLDGEASAMNGALVQLAERFRDQPLAGILLLTDGNATDQVAVDWKRLPPVYPVALGADKGLVDVSVARATVSQTNFEAAPVTIAAEIEGQGVSDRKIVVRVLDEAGKEVEKRSVERWPDHGPLVERFLLRSEKPGVSFYTVHAALAGEEKLTGPGRSAEGTLANNRRLATVDRGGGPYRVLYVTGRPNWEFKFLRRALDDDDEVDLVGLVRIAKKEPKFTFLGRPGERTNPLFRGFHPDSEQAEEYDQPVLIRLGTDSPDELRGGFPKSTEDLYRYHAVILDDVEAGFFTQDQLSLLQQFVSQRGGGFLMLGGKDSFVGGSYARTPVGEMLPIYLDRTPAEPEPGGYRLVLTREGWLQPWTRVRANEEDERRRLEAMPPFRTINRAESIKPGASVLAQVESAGGTARPALVVQQFGRGRAAALLVGDLWRWNLRRPDPAQSDLEKSWRQTVRWLVADVPKRVEVETQKSEQDAAGGVQVVVRARDRQFSPLDNAGVTISVQRPDGKQIEVVAESSDRAPGEYVASVAMRTPGAYRASVRVTDADGSEVGQRETGWSVEPQTDEFRTLTVNRPLLARIASETGGEVLSPGGLERFVSSLPNRKIPVVETWTYPLWHQWSVFLLAIACLAGEWGLRRWKGLP